MIYRVVIDESRFRSTLAQYVEADSADAAEAAVLQRIAQLPESEWVNSSTFYGVAGSEAVEEEPAR